MVRKISAIIIVALFCNCFTIYAQTQSEIKFKQKIVECGTNQNVKIKLTSNETLKGRITEIRDESFTLQFVDANGQVSEKEIVYHELHKFSKTEDESAGKTFKRGLLRAAAGVVVGVGTLLVLGLIARASID